MHVAPALPKELEPALHLVFAHLPHEESARRVANALDLLSSGDLDAEGIHVARCEARLIGAIVALPLAGAGGLIWLPGALPGPEQENCKDLLVAGTCSWLQSRGAKVIQAILLPAELSRAASLLNNGFQHVTQLLYLHHDLNDTPKPATETELDFQTYSQANDALFREILAQTYEATLDCPELNGVRTIDEIIEGHKAQGEPRHWWLASKFLRGVGVLMLTRVAQTPSWDISYVGVVPAARCVGVGRTLVVKAIGETQLFGADQLTVAVDVRNTPARQLYHQLGFEHSATREVFLYFPARTSAGDANR